MKHLQTEILKFQDNKCCVADENIRSERMALVSLSGAFPGFKCLFVDLIHSYSVLELNLLSY